MEATVPQRVGRANSAVDATCHSLNATPFARSKGGEQGEGGEGWCTGETSEGSVD